MSGDKLQPQSVRERFTGEVDALCARDVLLDKYGKDILGIVERALAMGIHQPDLDRPYGVVDTESRAHAAQFIERVLAEDKEEQNG